MKSSSGDRAALGLVLLGVLLVALLRPGLAAREAKLQEGRDPYLLPPPNQTLVMSLGYRAAVADVIFGHVLVAVGTHLTERRLFEFAGQYLDTINALDPKFRDPYRYADAIMTMQAVAVSDDTYRHARDILLRGTRELPYDQDLHLSAGQYLAYLAPQWLQNPSDAAEFKRQGTRLLARACELLGSNESVPYHCITAATLYSDAGNQAAAQAFLERMAATVDDPELQQIIHIKLERLRGAGQQSDAQRSSERLKELWQHDLPFVNRHAFNSLGPRFDAAACAGLAQAGTPRCATTFGRRPAADDER